MAKNTITSANVVIEGKDKSKKAIDKAQKNIGGLSGFVKKFGVQLIAATAATAGLVAFLKKSATAFGVQELAITKMEQALRSTATFTPQLSAEIQELASQLQNVSTFGDEVTLTAAGMLQSLGKLSGEGLKLALPLVQDLAAGLGTDLVTAARQVGQTLGSTTNALVRYGIVIDTAGTKQEKLIQLQKGINEQFGGAAAAQAKTYSGRIIGIDNAFGDLFEEVGAFVVVAGGPLLTFFKTAIDKANEFARTLRETFVPETLPLIKQLELAKKQLELLLKTPIEGEGVIQKFFKGVLKEMEAVGARANERQRKRQKKNRDVLRFDELRSLIAKLEKQINKEIEAANKIADAKAIIDAKLARKKAAIEKLALDKKIQAQIEAEDKITEIMEKAIQRRIDFAEQKARVEKEFQVAVRAITPAEQAERAEAGLAVAGGITDAQAAAASAATAAATIAAESLAAALATATTSVVVIAAVLIALAAIFKGMLDILGPIIIDALKPLFGALVGIGRFLGRVLLPIFKAMGDFIKAIILTIIAFIAVIAFAINRIKNLVTFGKVKKKSFTQIREGLERAAGIGVKEPEPALDKVDVETRVQASRATVTRPPDITNIFNFNGTFVETDFREFVAAITREQNRQGGLIVVAT